MRDRGDRYGPMEWAQRDINATNKLIATLLISSQSQKVQNIILGTSDREISMQIILIDVQCALAISDHYCNT